MARKKGIEIVEGELVVDDDLYWVVDKKRYNQVATVDYRGSPEDLMEQVNDILRERKCGFEFISIQDGSDQYVFAVKEDK